MWGGLLSAIMRRQAVISIFTLNYDWTFEKLAIENRDDYRLADGFELLGGQWNAERLAGFQAQASRINIGLFKLHGSTNWLSEGLIKSLGAFQDGLEMLYPAFRREIEFGDEFWSRASDFYEDRLASEPYAVLQPGSSSP